MEVSSVRIIGVKFQSGLEGLMYRECLLTGGCSRTTSVEVTRQERSNSWRRGEGEGGREGGREGMREGGKEERREGGEGGREGGRGGREGTLD